MSVSYSKITGNRLTTASTRPIVSNWKARVPNSFGRRSLESWRVAGRALSRSVPNVYQNHSKPAYRAQPGTRVKEKRSNGSNICSDYVYTAS
jgi:hypothetical protein